MEKTTWFKSKKKKEEMGSFKNIKRGGKLSLTKPNDGNQAEGVGGKDRIKSVIYVQHTRGSNLAKALREEEEAVDKITGYKLKIVERAGDSL